jgi:16S rRNA (guanine527-N7)-methyltransferase
VNASQDEATSPYGPLDFARDTGVPRETLSRLSTYVNLLVERNEHLNLVAASTLPDVWRRHVLDSAQLAPLIPTHATTIVDLGSGAGFPGMVLAIMLSDHPGLTVHLIESIQKKCRFLEEVAVKTAAVSQVHPARAEDVKGLKADVVTARAVAPLDRLLALAHPFFGPATTGLFLKGKALNDELTHATKSWKLDATPIPSKSDPSGTVLRVTGLTPWRRPRKPS